MRSLGFIACVATATVAPARAQNAAQTGVVVDARTGLPLAGATVAAGGIEVVAGDDGTFTLDGLKGSKIDVFVFVEGYEPLVVERRRGASWRLALVPDASVQGGELITVEAEAPPLTKPVPYDLRGDEVRTLPGAGNDALKGLQSLPGAARVPFGLGGLALRGSAPRDSAVYLDGIEVPILFHFGGLASFYPSGLLGSIELAPSGFSSRYGRAQGGLVELSTRAPRIDRWRVGGELSLVDAQVRAEGPGPKGGGWTMGLRRSYIDAVLAAAPLALTLLPNYWDAQLKYEVGTVERGRWTFLGFASSDGLTLVNEGDDPTGPDDRLDYTSRFIRLAARYQREVKDVAFDAVAAIGGDEVVLAFNDEGVTRRNVPVSARATVTKKLGKLGYVAAGLDVQGSRYAFELGGDVPASPDAMDPQAQKRGDTIWSADAALWTELLYPLAGKAIMVKPGVRGERYGLTNQWVLDPRLAILHQLPRDVTITESLGLYHQPANVADLDPAFGNQALRASSAVQAAITVSSPIARGFEATTTLYGQTMRDLPADAVTGATPISAGGSRQSGGIGAIATELADEQFGTYSYKENIGRGRAWGLELLLRKRTGLWTGWLGYTYSRSLRRGDPMAQSTYVPYVFDQPHLFTALGSVPLGKHWRIGARARYATGNPYTPIAGAFLDADDQAYQPRDGATLSARLPAFFQLDVRVDRSWFRPWGTLKLFVDVQNATNRLNPEGVTYNFDYSERSYTRGLPVFPSIGVEYIP
ncbi:MAG: TonB-dependent receptor [Kofleriaceae bacterium]|nr:TonB-dependent receptor [Kofleriaceae bacterium]